MSIVLSDFINLFLQPEIPTLDNELGGFYLNKNGLFKKILDALPDPVFAIDKDGRVIIWNKEIEKFTGVKEEEILGKGDFAYSKVFFGEARPCLVDLVLKPDKEVEDKYYINFYRDENGAVEGETYNSQLDYYDWGKAVPLRNQAGELEAVVITSRDMSRIKKYQRRQEELLKRYETLFSNSPDSIVCFDKNHMIFDVNESFINKFAYTREECIGKSPDDLVMPTKFRQSAVEKTEELFDKGIVDFIDTRYAKDGTPIITSIRGALIIIAGEVAGGFVIYTDITEKENYKEELESANTELAATVEQLISSEEELRAQYDEIQQYSENNEELMQKYEIAIGATDSYIWEINISDKTMEFSKNFIDLVGRRIYKKTDMYDIINKIVYEEDRDLLKTEILNCINNPKCDIDIQVRIIDKHDNIHWYLIRGKILKSKSRETIYGVMIDISDIKQKEEQIEYLANHDPLTKLCNRRKLSATLSRELKSGRKGALMLLDLDNFKKINDVLGHTYGDKLLRRIANMIKDLAPKDSITFRYGGDEFLILVREDNEPKIKAYIQNIRDGFKKGILVENFESNITVTMGIVRYPKDGNCGDELLIKADIALYTAKKSGKDKYLFFSESMEGKFDIGLWK